MSRWYYGLWVVLLWGAPLRGQGDPGKDVIGLVTTVVYFATDGDPGALGPRAQKVGPEVVDRLSRVDALKFASYLEVGRDTKPLFRSYENWAQPLPPSDEILLRFEAQSKLSKELMRMDLELWLSRKKILKTDAAMEPGKSLLVLGPEWRGGRLIVSLELAPGRPKTP
ncbi:MAG: hypothetical protein EAZ65_00085 [Verrucomicrobia bacterium]|nr:MAG: hypothetical protein EAZ84_10670 [Verrucomicrobiota bacterium]TAE89378.1 MAG: hypothetical protein EAZ82_01810 [Verrucomicrobiota bacterium]TAF27746.1 MAG: hypothetical protein EAZ71_00085 [Verrucomicrobiota bacterium]TAF42595.1 MAG: hypothetical protein EAZ65_00085 [Verrucomicrobiota bacterium]